MNSRPAVVEKEYTSAFEVDTDKLTRMLDILERRFREANVDFQPRFEVVLEDYRRLALRSIDEVFKLDNAVRNPIISLSVSAQDKKALEETRCEITYDRRMFRNISLRVVSSDSKWANEAFAELNEQAERTLLTSPIYDLRVRRQASVLAELLRLFVPMSLATIFVGYLMLSVIFSANDNTAPVDTVLSHSEIVELRARAESASTTDEKIDFLFDFFEAQLPSPPPPEPSRPTIDVFGLARGLVSWRSLFIAMPILVALGCGIYALRCCYPWASFLWGDYGRNYAELVRKRNTLWYVIYGSLGLGVLSNLFVLGLSEYLRPSG